MHPVDVVAAAPATLAEAGRTKMGIDSNRVALWWRRRGAV